MELLRKAVGEYWSKPTEYDMKNMTRAVTEEEWKKKQREILQRHDWWFHVDRNFHGRHGDY